MNNIASTIRIELADIVGIVKKELDIMKNVVITGAANGVGKAVAKTKKYVGNIYLKQSF
jgi:hypothetical protein